MREVAAAGGRLDADYYLEGLELDAGNLSALYALRGTVSRHGSLQVAKGPRGLLVRHPDGRVWTITDGVSERIVGPSPG